MNTKTTKHLTSLLTALVISATTGWAAHHEDGRLPVTAEEQALLTPDSVLADLKSGNQRFVAEAHTELNSAASIKAATKGQFPKAYILSCIDSRVPVEAVFDQGIGDIFVGRVAGNVENEDQLGSMEYAAAFAGVKLIVVMGHESCGAIKGACDNLEGGNLTLLLEKIAPAVRTVESDTTEERNSKNKVFVADVVQNNVKRTVADIRERSPVLAGLEAKGKIKIIGAHYALKDGSVKFIH